MTTLAEIREDAATGETAALYARIRAAQGTPLVNLIWRHLASIDDPPPSALAWAWPLIERARGRIDAALPALRGAADAAVAGQSLGTLPPIPAAAYAVIVAYDRGNSWNMLAMAVLAAVRAGAAVPDTPATATAEPSAPIPPIPVFETLDPDLRQMIERLASASPAAAGGQRPSLWVHLALWPDVLRALAAPAERLLSSPDFARAHASFAPRAAGLLGIDAPPPAFAAPSGEGATDGAIRRFRLRIAEMTLVGRVLLRDARATP